MSTSPRWGRRLGAGLAAVVLATGAGLAAAPGPAFAAACSTSSGVTVVVDFASVPGGGGIQTTCAGSPSTGVVALQVNHSVTGTVQFGLGFVCGIDGRPTAVTCPRTPPPDAYWSYWHAKRGGGWIYSDTGASNYHPVPGEVEGWAFGAGDPPASAPPPALPAPPPPAPPTPPGGGNGGGSGGGAPPTISSAATSPTPDPSAGTPQPSQPPVPTDPVNVPAPATAAPAGSVGPPTGTLVGAGVVLALAAIGGIFAIGRRRAAAPTPELPEQKPPQQAPPQ